MTCNDNRPEQAVILHRRAEDIEKKPPRRLKDQQMLYALQMYQTELKMQNETLRRAQEELEVSRARYVNLYDQAPVGYCTVGEKGVILEANLTAATLLGIARDALVKQPLTLFILPADQDIYYRYHRHIFETGMSQVCELRMLRRNGTSFWAWLEATAAQDDDGALVCLIVMSDITEYKRVEEALRGSEKRYQKLFESMSSGFALHEVILDERGNPADYRFLDINPAFEQFTGWKAADLVGRTVLDVSPDTAKFWTETYGRIAATGEPFHFETYSKILDKYFEVTIYKPEPGRYASIFQDITERKRAEEEKRNLEERLRCAEKMEALGTMAGGVAHDVNNILGALMGNAELLLLKIPKGNPLRTYVDNIFKSTRQGAAVIQDLLTLARRGVTASDAINLNSVVSDFLKTTVFEKLRDKYRQINFRTECDKDLLNIKGSPLHLEKTLMNLVSNAAEAITGAGEVTIRTENRCLDKSVKRYKEIKEGDYVVLTVSDTGTGIPPEDREKIFEPFYTKKKMGLSGTGLGLAIVWGTVMDHNGYIDLQTEQGTGTAFTLYFPATREELAAPEAKVPIEQYLGNGESVLVVDDIAEQRHMAAELLTRLGYNVHAVSSGEEAVEYLKNNKANILVLDMIMTPGIDGLETYRLVREINTYQKAIIVSGYSKTDRVKEALELGAGGYVKKPYLLEKIGMAIRDELRT